MKESAISICERTFVEQTVAETRRLDGRQTYDFRRIELTFGVNRGSCEVALGKTRVLSQVSCELTAPKASRPNDGILYINLELSPMAALHFEAGRQSVTGVEVNRLLERCLLDSRCVDLESLCIVGGEKVWSLRVDVHALNHDGNLVDCASIAAIASLCHFRRPDVTVSGDGVVVHPPEEKEPIPLSVYHMPICITFAFFDQGTHLLIDPTYLEEQVMEGKMVLGMNAYREICTLHMSGKMLLLKDQILRCATIAAKKVGDVTDIMKKALADDNEKRTTGSNVGFAQAIRTDTLLGSKHEPDDIFIEDVHEVAENLQQTVETSHENNQVNNAKITQKGPGVFGIENEPSNTWDIADTESEDEEIAEVTETPKAKIEFKELVETIDLSGDSEEEDIMILQPEAMQESGDQDETSSSRGWYKQDAFF